MANYPTSAPSFTTKNNGDTIQATHIDGLQDEVVAIGSALIGTLQHDVNLASGKKFKQNGTAIVDKVVQIVTATTSTTGTSTSNVYADTGLTATITPTSASNKVLVLVFQSGVGKNTGNTYCQIKLVRGVTDLIVITGDAGLNGGASSNFVGTCSAVYLDSPATTSATTYKTQFASGANIANAFVQADSSVSTICLIEVTP